MARTNPDRLKGVAESVLGFLKELGPSGEDDGDGDSVEDPAEAANKAPLQHRRLRGRPAAEAPRRQASVEETAAPSSGDRPGCPLIHDSF